MKSIRLCVESAWFWLVFACGCSDAAPFVEKTVFTSLYYLCSCQRSVDYVYMGLFLGSVFCSLSFFLTYLSFFFSPISHCFDYCD